MKAHTSQLVSLNEIVDGVLADLGESAHRKEQMLKWALDCFRRYKMDIARDVRETFLDMTAWKSVILPSDCVDWIRLGIKNNESINTLTNARLLTTRDCACDEDEPVEALYTPEAGSEGLQFNALSEFGEDVGKMYGLSVKDNGLGYYTPHPNQRVNEIQLSASVPAGTRIYLMYLSSLFDPDITNVVHPYCQDLIAYWCHYSNLKHRRRSGNRNISIVDIRDAKTEFDEELCLVTERRFDLRYEDIMEIIRSGHKMSPKQ